MAKIGLVDDTGFRQNSGVPRQATRLREGVRTGRHGILDIFHVFDHGQRYIIVY
jgi:hypothetical protein